MRAYIPRTSEAAEIKIRASHSSQPDWLQSVCCSSQIEVNKEKFVQNNHHEGRIVVTGVQAGLWRVAAVAQQETIHQPLSMMAFVLVILAQRSVLTVAVFCWC